MACLNYISSDTLYVLSRNKAESGEWSLNTSVSVSVCVYAVTNI